MALSIGTEAPDFALCFKGDDGIKIARLSDSYGKTNTVLLFFPMAFTSVCSAEMCDISKGLEEYPNATVYGISGDSPFSLDAWAKKENIKIPLLSDYDHAVAKAYDVVYESFLPQLNLIMWGVAKRSAFIVDKGCVIRYSQCSDDPRDLPDFEAVKTELKRLV